MQSVAETVALLMLWHPPKEGPIEGKAKGDGRDAAAATPAEVVVAIEDGLRGVLEED